MTKRKSQGAATDQGGEGALQASLEYEVDSVSSTQSENHDLGGPTVSASLLRGGKNRPVAAVS